MQVVNFETFKLLRRATLGAFDMVDKWSHGAFVDRDLRCCWLPVHMR